jgi:hypothetical protein
MQERRNREYMDNLIEQAKAYGLDIELDVTCSKYRLFKNSAASVSDRLNFRDMCTFLDGMIAACKQLKPNE